jgi:hypothetical protein
MIIAIVTTGKKLRVKENILNHIETIYKEKNNHRANMFNVKNWMPSFSHKEQDNDT